VQGFGKDHGSLLWKVPFGHRCRQSCHRCLCSFHACGR
jgi:hypothetical protein